MQIEPTMRGILTAFFRQRAVIVLVFSLVVLGGVADIHFSPVMYESRGSLLVKFGHEAVPDITKPDSAAEASENNRREIIGSDIEILKSHDVLQTIVNELGVETVYPGITALTAGNDSPVEAAIKRLASGDLSVKPGPEGYIIEVNMQSGDPQLPAKFIHRLFELFIERQSEVYNNPQTVFLQDQVTLASEHLKRSQQALQDFKTKVGVSSMEEELTRIIQEKGEAETIAFQAVDDAQAKLSTLEGKEANLLATYQPDSAPVQQIREDIAAAKKQLFERQADLKTPSQKKTQGTGILAAHIADLNRKINALEDQRNHYNDLARQVSIDEENYKNYTVHSEEARINETLNLKKVTQISVLDEPVAVMKPVRPRKKLIIGLCVLGGMLLSLGMAALAEMLDERFTAPEQVSATLQLPVLAAFPRIKKYNG